MREKETNRERIKNLFKDRTVDFSTGQDNESYSNEELGQFDNYLNELVENREIDFPLTDDLIDIVEQMAVPEPLSSSMLTRLNETIRKALDERKCQREQTVTFGSYLKNVRLEKGIEQRQLARQIDIAPSFLGEIESDVASPLRLTSNTFVKLCKVLQLKGREIIRVVRESKAWLPEVTYRGVPLTREDKGITLSERIEASRAAKKGLTSFTETQASRENLLLKLEKALKKAGLW